MAFRKRTYGGAFKRNMLSRKRGRFSRFRKRRSGGRRLINLSTNKGAARSFGFRSKRLSSRAYKKKLWDSSLMKAHYRSNAGFAGSITTNVGDSTSDEIAVFDVLGLNSNATAFWLLAGGAKQLDPGNNPPGFIDDIVVRGGIASISIYNNSTAHPIRASVYLIKESNQPNYGIIPSEVSELWDPTLVADFAGDIGKVLLKRTFLIESNATEKVMWRVPIFKIDQGQWLDSSSPKRYYRWLVQIGDFDPLAANLINVLTAYNVSFTGDGK